jgi:hypothetical protein
MMMKIAQYAKSVEVGSLVFLIVSKFNLMHFRLLLKAF